MESGSSDKSSLASGYMWTFGSTALPLVSAFLVSLVVARWMGPRVVGLINWTMALATILLIPAKFGIEGAASRLVSEYEVTDPRKTGTLIRKSVLFRAAVTVPMGILAVIFSPQLASFFHEDALVPLFRIAGVIIFSVSFNELSAFLILGFKKFRFLFMIRSLMFLIRVGLVVLAAMMALDAAGVLWAYAAATLVPAIIVFTILLGAHGEKVPGEESKEIWRRLVRLSAPLAISGASVTIYSLLDKLMLGYFRGASQVGIYSMARSLLETSLFPTFALIMILRPMLAGAWSKDDREGCRVLINRSLGLSMLFASLVTVVFVCLSEQIVVGLYKVEFIDSAKLLVMFLPLMVMRSLGSVILPGLIAAEKAGTYAKLTLTGAVLNFVLNIVLIPRYGAVGAVVSTLVSYLPIEILGLRALAVQIPGIWKAADGFRALKAIAVSAAMIFLYRTVVPVPSTLVATIAQAAVITMVHLSALLAVRAVTREELAGLLASVKRR